MKKIKPDTEIYKLTQDKRFCKNYAHTDNIEYVEGDSTDGKDRGRVGRAYKNKEILVDEVMDFEDYNNSVEANSTPTYTEEDYPKEGIRVIVYENK